MKLAAVLLVSATAHAGSFEEYARQQAPRPASQLMEASCDVDVELRGAIASVEVRQRIVNPGPTALAARYGFELPKGAVVTGFRAKMQGAAEIALAVPSDFNTTMSGASDVLGIDPAVLYARDVPNAYEVLVQPIEPDRDVTLTTQYVAVAEARLGALHLELPGRALDGKLTVCKGTLRATLGAGAKVGKIRIGGAEVGGRGTAPITLDREAVTIDVDVAIAGRDPVVWTQSQPLADGWTASLVTVLAPRLETGGTKRVVFLVDVSRSMDLVGRQNVIKVVRAIAGTLPADAEMEAIAYDRTAQRAFGEFRKSSPGNFAVLEGALLRHGSGNGSDIVAAYKLARQTLANTRGPSTIVTITDGFTADLANDALVTSLDPKSSNLDVHTIVLDPANTRAPNDDVLRAPIDALGGAYVEVRVDELDHALLAIDDWMRPSVHELQLGTHDIPRTVRGGAGFTQTIIHKGKAPLVLTGNGTRRFRLTVKPGPSVPVAALALAGASAADFTASKDPDATDLAAGEKTLDRAYLAFPFVDPAHAFAVLTANGRIAKNRRAVVQGGGRYERVVAVADPSAIPTAQASATAVTTSAIAKITLERLFREQLQPKAYACYQRALGTNTNLAGTARFHFRMGRGEITDVQVTGLGDATFDACLTDAAYLLSPPMPDFKINADDLTIANYPLSFNRRADQPVIVLGDADSTSPIDIDAVEGGVPGRVKVNAKTPLGGMRAPKTP